MQSWVTEKNETLMRQGNFCSILWRVLTRGRYWKQKRIYLYWLTKDIYTNTHLQTVVIIFQPRLTDKTSIVVTLFQINNDK